MDFTKLSKISDASGDTYSGVIEGKEIGTDDQGNRIIETVNEDGDVVNITVDKDGNPISDSLFKEDLRTILSSYPTFDIVNINPMVIASTESRDAEDTHKDLEEMWKVLKENNIESKIVEYPSLPGTYALEIVDSVYDSISSDRAAENAVFAENVYDLYTEGETSINIPFSVDPHEFTESCISYIESIWGEPDVNFDYGDLEVEPRIEGNILYLKIK